jgi:hypothetical protein
LGEIQKIEKEYECFDSEKREESECPRLQSPLEVAVLAMERVEKTGEDHRAEAISVGSL